MAHAGLTETIEVAGRPFAPYISEEAISERTDALAKQIAEDYQGRPLHFIHVALGGVFWAVDLTRAVRRHAPGAQFTHDSVRFSSYGHRIKSSGHLRMLADLAQPELLKNRDVIVVDEIIDSGLTMSNFVGQLKYGILCPDGQIYTPATVAVAALTDKASVHNGRVTVNYAGFEVPDAFLLGCGMDYQGEGRELPAIYQSATPDDKLVTDYIIPPTSSPFAQPS